MSVQPIERHHPVKGETSSETFRGENESIGLVRRVGAWRSLISFGIAFAFIAIAFSQMNIDFGKVWAAMRNAQPALLLVAFAAYYAAFPLRALRWRSMLENASVVESASEARLPISGLTRIYLLSWLANCIAPAKLGDMYRGYLLKQRTNASFTRTFGTIIAERLLDTIALMVVLIVAGTISFHGAVPASLHWVLAIGAALALIAVAMLVSLAAFSHQIRRFVPARARPHYVRIEEGIVASLSRRNLPFVSAMTGSIWLLEGIRVLAIVSALSIKLNLAECLFVALLASLLTAVPITPAGLGAVESGSIVALKLFDIDAVSAGAVTLIDRGVAYWSVLVIGGVVWLVTARRNSTPRRAEAAEFAADPVR